MGRRRNIAITVARGIEGAPDELAGLVALVAVEVVHDHDIAGRESVGRRTCAAAHRVLLKLSPQAFRKHHSVSMQTACATIHLKFTFRRNTGSSRAAYVRPAFSKSESKTMPHQAHIGMARWRVGNGSGQS